MARTLKVTDAVVVGMGAAGTILALELARAGLRVVGLERGRARDTVPDFQSPGVHDELKYSVRLFNMQDAAREAVTFRNHPGETALPLRRWGAFRPGTGLGGSAAHYNAVLYRQSAADFRLRSHLTERYGAGFIPGELPIQDWGVSYDELEPFYDRFEKVYGVSGKAGNLRGKLQPGGSPFEAPRSDEYPNPPMKEPFLGRLFRDGVTKLGYTPFFVPSGCLSRPYVNPEGAQLAPCMFCGYCAPYLCEHFAKATPQTTVLPALMKQPGFELRTRCQVLRVERDSTGKKATGVLYADPAGEEVFQPASLVIVAAFPLNNVRLMLLSGIGRPYDVRTGEGVVGRNYAYQTQSGVLAFFDENTRINPFMNAGAAATTIDDLANDNFDHGPLGFIGGAAIMTGITSGAPIGFRPVPPETPKWGQGWKEAVYRHWNHTGVLSIQASSAPTRTNYLDLDPTYQDAWGRPLLRMTFDYSDNDVRMSAWLTEKTKEIGRAMGAKLVTGNGRSRPFVAKEYQSSHNVGGLPMGADPGTSAVNQFLQSWDVPNLFVVGASAFSHNTSYNPTGTVGALSYWTADAITKRYLKAPGPLA